MPDDRHLDLSPSGLRANVRRLGPGGSLTVLIVCDPTQPAARRRLGAIDEACAEAGAATDERLVGIHAHELPAGNLERTVVRVHLAVVVLSDAELVRTAVRLLDEERVPRLVLLEPASSAFLMLEGVCGEHASLLTTRGLRDAQTQVRDYLRDQMAHADRLRGRSPQLLHEGVNATRLRAVRAWEACDSRTQAMVAAWNSRLPGEVTALLCADRVKRDDEGLLGQIEQDLRALGRQTKWALDSDVLEAAELDAYRRFCSRQGIARSSNDARLLLSLGEERARDRHGKLAQGAEARDSLSKDTAWAKLWAEM